MCDADIFVENLRSQLDAQEGYTADDLAELRPGIIYARIKLNTLNHSPGRIWEVLVHTTAPAAWLSRSRRYIIQALGIG